MCDPPKKHEAGIWHNIPRSRKPRGMTSFGQDSCLAQMDDDVVGRRSEINCSVEAAVGKHSQGHFAVITIKPI